MVPHQLKPVAQSQRISVTLEADQPTGRVKVCLESYDEYLGWYPAGALSIPLHQLPLLEQALEEIRIRGTAPTPSPAKIIPFPGVAAIPPA